MSDIIIYNKGKDEINVDLDTPSGFLEATILIMDGYQVKSD